MGRDTCLSGIWTALDELLYHVSWTSSVAKYDPPCCFQSAKGCDVEYDQAALSREDAGHLAQRCDACHHVMNHQRGHPHVEGLVGGEGKRLGDIMLGEFPLCSNALPCSFDHRAADVNANDLRSMLDEPGCLQSGSTPDVQDPSAPDGRKEAQYRGPIIVYIVHAFRCVLLEILGERIVGGGDGCDVRGIHTLCRSLPQKNTALFCTFEKARAMRHLFAYIPLLVRQQKKQANVILPGLGGPFASNS